MERSRASTVVENDQPTTKEIGREERPEKQPTDRLIDPSDRVEPGHTIGRYIVARVLGAGSMGVVYQAYDPELDRMVAVKTVRARDGLEEPSAARIRLKREAQAMAKLQHPNVVAVHDVGEHEGEIFIAMERIDGSTLRKWQRRGKTWSQMLTAYIAAGEGLAAAHHHGVVHRDFKPSNVLIGDDGRVCVADFGLAGATRADSGAPVYSDARTTHDSDLTRRGVIMGTPAYMAPELHEDVAADARSDLYAFCVALYEGLFGVRPFLGETMATLLEAKREFSVVMPSKPAVPRHIKQTIMRGLQPDPQWRWADMDALLVALRRRSRVVPWMLAIGGGGILFAAGTLLGEAPSEQGCDDIGAAASALWNDDARERMRDAFLATGKGYAQGSADRVGARLDEYVLEWTDVRVDLCEATRVRHEQPEVLMSVRMACLDLRLDELESLVEILQAPDAATVIRATNAVQSLRSIAECRTADSVGGGVRRPDDPAQRERGDEGTRRLLDARALSDTGHYAEALEVVHAVEKDLIEADDPAVLAKARYLGAIILDRLGDPKEAEAALFHAIWSAEEARDRVLEVRAWTKLAWIVGYRGGHREEALRHGEHARAVAASLDGDSDELGVRLSNTLGLIHFSAGDYDQALALQRQALTSARSVYPPGDLRLGTPLVNLGLTHYARNEPARAADRHAEALALHEDLLGPEHPYTALVADDLALALHDLGDHERAIELTERALRVRLDAFGEHHPEVAISLRHVGELESCEGRLAPARNHFDRAITIYTELDQPPSRGLSAIFSALAELDLKEGKHELAEQHWRRALEYDAELAPDHPRRVTALLGLAELELARDASAEALEWLARARISLEAIRDPVLKARASFAEAQATLAHFGELAKARRLGEQARAGYRQSLDPARDRSAEVERWLSRLPAR